jgi:hypothetical protein
MAKDWEAAFPNLGNWTCTSKATTDYNCIAFAVGDEDRRWEPCPGYFWPVDKDYSVGSLIEALKTEGFELCADGSLVEGREKIVIYLNRHAGWEHVARQEPDGKWKSKLGDEEDILHESPESLTSTDYGRPTVYMDRARKPKTGAEETAPTCASSGEAPPSGAANPKRREDFTAMLNAAVRKCEPKG